MTSPPPTTGAGARPAGRSACPRPASRRPSEQRPCAARGTLLALGSGENGVPEVACTSWPYSRSCCRPRITGRPTSACARRWRAGCRGGEPARGVAVRLVRSRARAADRQRRHARGSCLPALDHADPEAHQRAVLRCRVRGDQCRGAQRRTRDRCAGPFAARECIALWTSLAFDRLDRLLHRSPRSCCSRSRAPSLPWLRPSSAVDARRRERTARRRAAEGRRPRARRRARAPRRYQARTGSPASEIEPLAQTLVVEARRHRLDPALVLAVVHVESRYDTYAVSNKDAIGLMQILPTTGEWLAPRSGVDGAARRRSSIRSRTCGSASPTCAS